MKPDTLDSRETARDRPTALPRVLYVLDLDPGKKFGSMEEQLVLLAERFRAGGGFFFPLFTCDPAADVAQFRERGVAARCLGLRDFSWGALRDLRRLVREERIDVVHWNFAPPLTNPYLWALTLLAPGVQHWFTDHNSRLLPPPPRPAKAVRWLKRLLLRRYRRVFCVSRYVQDCLEEQGSWSNLVCVRHFINTERFRPDADARRELRTALQAEGKFVLLVVAHLIKEKGVDIAVRALAELPDARLWIVGEGPEEGALRSLIAELGLKDRARLLGLQAQVEAYLQSADCFVCPSLWGEAAGLVIIEAQACGTPVIASRVGGIPEYVADGRAGILFTPGDHRELARCVRRLVDDPALRRRFAEQARADALERFSPQSRLPEYLDLYRRWGVSL